MLYIFDADGTLRADCGGRPPFTPTEQVILPGVREKLSGIDWSNNAFAIASNQASVGRGLVSHDMAFRLLWNLALQIVGIEVGAFYGTWNIKLCPHLPEDGCQCRKPEPGMLLSLLGEIEPETAVFVGDAETDKLAAERAGIEFRWAKEFFNG